MPREPLGWADVLEFGERAPGTRYEIRRGAYAVVRDAAQRIALIRNPRGVFLPGGGIEPSETPEQALARELREECGHALASAVHLGVAIQFVHVAGHAYGLEKHGVFFLAELGAAVPLPGETEDEVCWLGAAQAASALTFASQAWVLRRVSAGFSSGVSIR